MSDNADRFEISAHQFSDYYGATRHDSLSRLLHEAQTGLYFVEDSRGNTGEASYHFPELASAAVYARASDGYVVLTLYGAEAVSRVFRTAPKSAIIFRALPFPIVDSLAVPVRYVNSPLNLR